jgi:hypothetical protein
MRNRSQGWTHAKLSGHKNESLIAQKIIKDAGFSKALIEKIGKTKIINVEVGGLFEQSVSSVLGTLTKSKTDLAVTWNDDTKSNFSIKKSAGGQVYLIRTSRFIDGYQKHFGSIPGIVQNGLMLYFGEHPDTIKILASHKLKKSVNPKIRVYEKRKKRLVWDSLVTYDKKMANSLLDWIKSNIGNIVEFCFSRGLAADRSNWAEFIWYNNLLREEEFDEIIPIKLLKNKCIAKGEKLIFLGSTNGGSTIQLPFGFLQWHQGQMQFHHRIGDVLTAIE